MSRTWPLTDRWAATAVAAGSLLLGAPAGLLWSTISPRAIVTMTAQGPEITDVESNKAFIGADGSYLLVVLGMGVLCGLIAWWLFRRSGPWAVLGLVLGGSIAGIVAGLVGVLPGAESVVDAVSPGSPFRGSRELYLGRLHDTGLLQTGHYHLSVRAFWAFLGWPAGACLAFLVASMVHPDELDGPASPPSSAGHPW